MVSKEAKVDVRGARAFIARAYYLLALKLHFDKDDGVLSGKRRLELLREGHHLCRNPSLGLATKGRACKGVGQ